MSPGAAVFLFVPGHPVQEDERNSTEERAPPQPDLDPPSQTGTSSSPIGPDVVTGTDEGRGRLHQGQEPGASSPRSPSSSTSEFQGLLRPASHPRRRTVAGNADREALLFPEETTNNRADTSGAAHLTDGPVSASRRTRPYFQNTFSSATFHTSQSTNTESYKFPQTQMPVNASASSRDGGRTTASRTSEFFPISGDHPPASGASIPSLTSSLPASPFWITWEAETTLNPQEEKEPSSWRSQRSTGTLHLLSTSAPLKTPTAQQEGEPGWGPTRSTFWSSTRNPGVTPAATAAASASDQSESKPGTQAFTSPPRSRTSAALATRSMLSYVTPPFTQTSTDTSPPPTPLRDSEPVSLLADWIIAAAASSPPRAASALEDVSRKAAAPGSHTGSESETQGLTFTRLPHPPPTVPPTPVPLSSSALSSTSTPAHQRPSHAPSPSAHTASTAAEPSGQPLLWNQTSPGPSAVNSTPSPSPHPPATPNESHDFSTATRLTSPTEHKDGEGKEGKSWRWLPSSTPAGSSQKPGTTLPVPPEDHPAPSSDVPASTTSQTPRFFIVPDQPAAIKGAQRISCHSEGRGPGV